MGNVLSMNSVASRSLVQWFHAFHEPSDAISLSASIMAVAVLITCFILARVLACGKKSLPPAIPGVLMLGNALQLREKRPHCKFTAWAQKYGPIFTIKTGMETLLVISSSELAKEVLISKHHCIATRKISKAISTLTGEKTMVVVGDYDDQYRMLKKLVVTYLLGPVPLKENQNLRERTSYKMLDEVFAQLHRGGNKINFRHFIKEAVFALALYEVIGRDPEAVFIKEWGRSVSRCEVYKILVTDPLKMATEFDWRDFFPAFKWLPNRGFEERVNGAVRRATTVVRALIEEQKEVLKNGKERSCFLDTLLTISTLTDRQREMLTWETIIESADTTIVTTEWAMYELAKNPARQERLYEELKAIVGHGIVTEDHIPKLDYLNAVVKETLRLYPPTPVLLPRHVSQDVQLGGYDIPKGWQILINVYGINNDPNVWTHPEMWDPDRMLAAKGVDMGFQDHRMLSFSTGKRMCPGMTQAMYVTCMNIAICVQHFKWSLPPKEMTNPMADTTFFTIHKLNPLIAIASARVGKRLNAD